MTVIVRAGVSPSRTTVISHDPRADGISGPSMVLNDLLLYRKIAVEGFGSGESLGASWTCVRRYRLLTGTPML